MLGFDPGDFSRNLMRSCAEFFYRENRMSDAKSLLLKAYDVVQDKTCYGSSTACVLTLDHRNNHMTIANVGDSGYLLFRNGKIIRRSVPQRITYDCPKQLDSYPWKEASRKMGVNYTDILYNTLFRLVVLYYIFNFILILKQRQRHLPGRNKSNQRRSDHFVQRWPLRQFRRPRNRRDL